MQSLHNDEATEATLAAIERFNEACNRHAVDEIMAAMTDDCLFENTYPPPDGQQYMGQEAVRGFWEALFGGSPGARFDTEEIFACGDRCVVRWVYNWAGAGSNPGHVRGVDVFRLQDGKIAEKLSYVKG